MFHSNDERAEMSDFPTDSSLAHVIWHIYYAEVKYFDETGTLQTVMLELGQAVECGSLPGLAFSEYYGNAFNSFISECGQQNLQLPDGTLIRTIYSFKFVDYTHEYELTSV